MWISAFPVYEPTVKQPSRQEEEATIDSGRVAECCVPLIYTLLQRLTQATFKLTRWLLRVHWHRPTSLSQVLPQLRTLYAKL